MKVTLNAVDVTLRVDFRTLTPLDSDLTQVPTASFVLEDPTKTLTTSQEPRLWHEVVVYDDDNTTVLFGGYVNAISELEMHPVGRAWRLNVQGYMVRTLETATGSLNKSGLTDSDRNFIIAIFRDALQSQTFAGSTIDDAILTANEAVSWSGVQFVAYMSGLDWSYQTPSDAMTNLLKYVPNVYWSIGADKLVNYGLQHTLAPFALSTSPNGTTTVGFEQYSEQTLIKDHKNKMRRGGAAASEVTATDETSFARFGRILDSPYANDTAVPSTDLKRRTYAELKSKRTRRTINARVHDKGLASGQLVDIVNARVGSGTRPAVLCIMDMAIARSVSGAIAGERGRMVITKVRTVPLGNRKYAYDVEAGDLVQDFALTLPAEAG